LREALEAALLMSVLLACARFLNLGNRWIWLAIALGLVGAVSYGFFLEPVSELFDGVGQEICNALLQLTAFILLVILAFRIPDRAARPDHNRTVIATLMTFTVALAITGEGAEILVYVSGFWSVNSLFSAVAIGSLIGACIGLSVGILIYYLLLGLAPKRLLPIAVMLLVLIAAGMSSQAVRLLIQADWVTSAGALWDTSGILSEETLVGQLLYALIGYEATPSAVEFIAYVGSIAVVSAAFIAGLINARRYTDYMK